jgi:hypothetical protein
MTVEGILINSILFHREKILMMKSHFGLEISMDLFVMFLFGREKKSSFSPSSFL